MYRIFLVALFLSSAIPGYSQLVSFGVKGGVLLTDPLDTSASIGLEHGVRRYIVGATGELHLPFGLSVEADALYRRLGYDTYFSAPSVGRTRTSSTGSDWQFPVLAKYAFKRKPFVSPFVDGGVTYRHVSLSNVVIGNPNTVGVSVGAGVTLKFLFIRLAPEIRYTYFPSDVFGSGSLIHSTSNQADFLVGLTF